MIQPDRSNLAHLVEAELLTRFDNQFPVEIVRAEVRSAIEHLSPARISGFVPSLVYKIAQDRLRERGRRLAHGSETPWGTESLRPAGQTQ